MLSRRSFFAGLAALPFARLLEPLARWFKPAAPVVANTRRAVFIGAEAAPRWYSPVDEAERAYATWMHERRDRAFHDRIVFYGPRDGMLVPLREGEPRPWP